VDIIDNVKLRKFIYQRLSKELSDKIYYPYGKDIWIFDLDEVNWYFQYDSEGKLNYNPKFFDDFFYFFSLEQKQYQILLKKWVEISFGHPINQISRKIWIFLIILMELLEELIKFGNLTNVMGFHTVL
jgi:hypothetical protein